MAQRMHFLLGRSVFVYKEINQRHQCICAVQQGQLCRASGQRDSKPTAVSANSAATAVSPVKQCCESQQQPKRSAVRLTSSVSRVAPKQTDSCNNGQRPATPSKARRPCSPRQQRQRGKHKSTGRACRSCCAYAVPARATCNLFA